jgi:hypothetical protein
MQTDQLPTFRKCFPGKLRFWAIHCTINALPSYLIAVVWLELWPVAQAHWAMLAAVLTFVFGYSVLTSWVPVLREGRNLFTRALKVGLVIRTILSLLTVFVVPLGIFLLFTPDYWCGQVAVNVVARCYDLLGLESTLGSRVGGGSVDVTLLDTGFMEVYLTTVLEGLILSFMLFILSFMAIIILQMRDRKNPALWRGPSNP